MNDSAREGVMAKIGDVASRAIEVVEGAASTRGMGSPVEATAVTTINRPPQEVYDYWRDLQRLPTFMTHLESVTVSADGTSHWVARAPAGGRVEWDATLVQDTAGERIAWASVPGSGVDNAGSVEFRTAPADQGTEVHVRLQFRSPLGPVGAVAAKLSGEHPQQQIGDDLRRFKQILETGEVLRSDGSPEGTRTIDLVQQEPATPTEEQP